MNQKERTEEEIRNDMMTRHVDEHLEALGAQIEREMKGIVDLRSLELRNRALRVIDEMHQEGRHDDIRTIHLHCLIRLGQCCTPAPWWRRAWTWARTRGERE